MNQQKADNELFIALFDQYFGQLVLFAKKIVSSRHEAEDIVHDVFLSLLQHKRIHNATPAYLFTCVKNEAINYVTRYSNRFNQNNIPELTELPEVYQLESEMEYYRRLESLYNKIEELPPQSRKVLKEVMLKKQSYIQVAEQMGVSINTIKAHMYNAMKMLRGSFIPLLFLSLVNSVV